MRAAQLITIAMILAIFLTACFPSVLARLSDSDPMAAARNEAAILHTLVHKEDSYESIYGTLTARNYQCSDYQKDSHGGQTLVCGKAMCWTAKHRCGEEVQVVRIKNADVDNLGIDSFESGTYCRTGRYAGTLTVTPNNRWRGP